MLVATFDEGQPIVAHNASPNAAERGRIGTGKTGPVDDFALGSSAASPSMDMLVLGTNTRTHTTETLA